MKIYFPEYKDAKEMRKYYTTREENPLKNMQSLIVVACKRLRVIFAILKEGSHYDLPRLLGDIRRARKEAAVA